MTKLFIAAFMLVSSFGTNVMADGHAIKMGIILGFTGPIESLTPAMAGSAELAFKEASDSGSLLGGKKIDNLKIFNNYVKNLEKQNIKNYLQLKIMLLMINIDFKMANTS